MTEQTKEYDNAKMLNEMAPLVLEKICTLHAFKQQEPSANSWSAALVSSFDWIPPPCFKSRPFRSHFFQFLMRSMECHRFTWRSNTVIQRSSSFSSMPELTRTCLTLTDSPDSPDSPLYYAKNNEHQSVNFLSFLFLESFL